MSTADLGPWRIWRVYVLQPLQPRQRKHSLFIYRVGAVSKEDAIERCRAELIDRDGREPHITGATTFGEITSVVFDGSVTRTPDEAAKLPRL